MKWKKIPAKQLIMGLPWYGYLYSCIHVQVNTNNETVMTKVILLIMIKKKYLHSKGLIPLFCVNL